jgi:hypothetical protein
LAIATNLPYFHCFHMRYWSFFPYNGVMILFQPRWQTIHHLTLMLVGGLVLPLTLLGQWVGQGNLVGSALFPTLFIWMLLSYGVLFAFMLGAISLAPYLWGEELMLATAQAILMGGCVLLWWRPRFLWVVCRHFGQAWQPQLPQSLPTRNLVRATPTVPPLVQKTANPFLLFGVAPLHIP